MDHQPVPVHPQKRVVQAQLRQPGLRGHMQGHKVLQQLPKPSHCLLFDCIKTGGGSLLLLLLLLLLPLLLPLPDTDLMLLLDVRKCCWLQQLINELLVWRDPSCLLLLGCCRCLLLLTLLNTLVVGRPATNIHGIDCCQTHNTPHTLVRSTSALNPYRRWAHHAQHMLRLQPPRNPPNKLLLQSINNRAGHRGRERERDLLQ